MRVKVCLVQYLVWMTFMIIRSNLTNPNMQIGVRHMTQMVYWERIVIFMLRIAISHHTRLLWRIYSLH